MQVSFRVKIGAGKRTKTWVSAYGTAVNEKIVTLPNGERISDTDIAKWLEKSLLEALIKLGGNYEPGR